jgi:hypothetical protein
MEKVNKIINEIKENKWIHYAIIVIIGIILSLPLCKIEIRETHDGSLHLLRLIGTINALKISEFPPIVVPYYCNGGGYAMNLFYNPLVTYIPLLIKLFTPTYVIALKVFGGLCIIASGFSMYKCVNYITNNKKIALFASIMYLIAPYKLSDVYIRYAIGEFATFIFLPLLFIGMYSLFNLDGKKHYYISIGAIGLLLTHTVTTFYTAIFCAIYVLCNIKSLKDKKVIKKIIINVIFILLVTMLYWLPLLEAKSKAEYTIFVSDIMGTNGVYVYENTLELSEFFVDIGEMVGDKLSATYIIGVPTFVLMCLTIFTYKKIDEKYKGFYLLAWLFAIISLFMCTKYCPWFIIPDFFCKLQYPWRMMGFFILFMSFITGVNLYILLKYLLEKDITRLLIVTIVIVASVLYTIPILMQYKTNNEGLDEQYEYNIIQNPYIHYFSINRDYLPKKAILLQTTYLYEKECRIYVLQGNAEITDEEMNNLTYTATIQNCSKDTIIEIPFFYYPGYKIVLENNGEIIKLDAVESENGFVSAVINQDIDEAKLTVEYHPTTITYVSYVVSFIAVIIFVMYVIFERKTALLID